MDDAETNQRFAESLELDYPILSDPTKEVAAVYGVLGAIGMAKRWTIYIGKDGKVLHVDDDVHVETCGKDVAATLARLGIPRRPAP